MLGVIFGGSSYEHEISIVSAIALKKALKQKLVFIFCDSARAFYQIDENSMRATYFSKGEYKKLKSIALKNGGFYTQSAFGSKKIEVSAFINLIHGRDGEDGKIPALFDFYDVAYIGPRIEASVMSYSKILTKNLAQNAGVKVVEFEKLDRNLAPKMAFPFILKPAHLGSSIGIATVKNQNELEFAKDTAFEFDDEVIIEPFLEGVKEYNLAGCKIGDKFHFSIVEEPKKGEVLDFDQKYLSFSGNSEIKEAQISADLKAKMQEMFAKIYDCGFAGAVIRCDFFVHENEVYLNEINPNPGSLAYYLFDDFENMVNSLSKSLPKERKIDIKYKYINSISSNK